MKTIIVALLCLCLLAFTVNAEQQQQKPKSSGCDVCQFFVKELENQVSKYEGQITELFKKEVCGKLNKLEAPCNRFVDAYGTSAIKYLINKFDKMNVCGKLNLCKDSEWVKDIFTSEEAFEVYQQMQSQAEQPIFGEAPYCGICQYAVSNLEQYINASESEIEQAALKLCKKLPSQYEQMCDTLVLMYLPNIIEQLLAEVPPHKACCKMTLCHDNCDAPKQPEPVQKIELNIPEGKDGNCAVCQFVVTNVENYLAQQSTQEEIIKQVNLLCSRLPTKFAQVCVNVADNYIPHIIYYIEQNFPAEKVCQLIGVCPSAAPVAVVPKQKVGDAQACQICTLAMTILQQYINQNSTDIQIRTALENACQKLPSQYSGICVTMVDTYEPIVMIMIRQYIATHQLSQVCHDIGVCSSKYSLTCAEKNFLAANPNSVFCAPCMAVVTLAEQQLSAESTRHMIKDKLFSLCGEIPSEQISHLCRIAVVAKTDELIDAILARASPSEVCTVTGLCAKKNEPLSWLNDAPKKSALPEQGSPLACSVCKEIVSVADNFITSETTVAQIKHIIENVVCDRLPASFNGVCTAYVETYADQLISALAKGVLSPDHVCKIVGACANKDTPSRQAQKFGLKQNRVIVN